MRYDLLFFFNLFPLRGTNDAFLPQSNDVGGVLNS